MKLAQFFKILSYKINKYDNKYKTNPFTRPQSITLVWVEDNKKQNKK